MTQVVINKCFGGFSVSKDAVLWLREHGHEAAKFAPVAVGEPYEDGTVLEEKYASLLTFDGFMRDISRTDPLLIQCISEIGAAANGELAKLVIVDVPDDVQWYIHEYDGMETIEESHRSWG